MTGNRSPRWEQPESDFHHDLAAVLDGADVSERVRAAIAHALAKPDALSSYVNSLVTRYTTSASGGRGATGRPPGRTRCPAAGRCT
ncbi:hypothetical protein [Micromonospora sp. MW-13]|uniref:hypothetical protein n=1 Tax=Micromonospora sp. MW-13 TaxID=2094022 RepID=UPI001FB44A73|nr:hypothetical protein [Micromonospora sp. MW-13]